MISEKPSSPEYGIINWQTPIASGILNSTEGDNIILYLPKGETNITIKEIKKAK